ncbi:MAG: hypothetical protein KDK39_02565 [Leptospiraceae bacterium]|nr:hypothetical protein [Leptospiraceae bacterium]
MFRKYLQVWLLIIFCTNGFLHANPAQDLAKSAKLSELATSVSFLYMPLSETLERKGGDSELCYHTGIYLNTIMLIVNLILPELEQDEKYLNTVSGGELQTRVWQIKRNVLNLEGFCGLQNDWPLEWNIQPVLKGDRVGYTRIVNSLDQDLRVLFQRIFKY